MRRFFRRIRHKPTGNPAQEIEPASSSSIIPQVSTPGTHVCTSLCAGIASISPEYHESIIAHLAQGLGQTPDRLRTQNISLNFSNARIIDVRDVVSELDERRDIEGNTDLAQLPLDLPTTHQYSPLPKGHARFLRFLGLGPHPLAELESHSLDNPPPYSAISYCWDPSSPRRGMFVGRQSLSISETVLEVLNQVQASQHATGSRKLLWIDQVCINQEDQNEKLDQVYRMGEIYSKAEEVFVWLGPTANESNLALENMNRMLSEVVDLNNATTTRADVPGDLPKVINEDHGHLYGHLFMRPWFRRLWTVQEALLARRLVVMCGYQEVNFALLVDLATEILTYGSLDVIQPPGASDEEMDLALVGIVNLHRLRWQGASIEDMLHGLDVGRFRSLVSESRSRQVTMAADRVYALMGVAPRLIRESMAGSQDTTHGNQKIWQLYTQFAKCILENDPEWYFLSSAPSKGPTTKLPSWVPNLNSPSPFASTFAQPSCGFSAGISPGTRHLINRSITTKELRAQGFRLDIVSEIVPQTAFREEDRNMKPEDVYGDAAREWDEACMRLCQRVFNLGPEQFPSFHLDILLAQSGTAPAMDGHAADAYDIFYMACRLRREALGAIHRSQVPIPEHFRHLPDAADRFADHALTVWRNSLPVEEYRLLLEFTGRMKSMCSGRPYISTSTGFIGLGCPGIQVGDVICILYGTTVPYVLRPKRGGAMTFVGDAYIYSVMNGEALGLTGKGPDEMIHIH